MQRQNTKSIKTSSDSLGNRIARRRKQQEPTSEAPLSRNDPSITLQRPRARDRKEVAFQDSMRTMHYPSRNQPQPSSAQLLVQPPRKMAKSSASSTRFSRPLPPSNRQPPLYHLNSRQCARHRANPPLYPLHPRCQSYHERHNQQANDSFSTPSQARLLNANATMTKKKEEKQTHPAHLKDNSLHRLFSADTCRLCPRISRTNTRNTTRLEWLLRFSRRSAVSCGV